MPTRSQTMMKLAMKHVKSVQGEEHNQAATDRPISLKYGKLCHKFPILVRTCGLCQAVAFIESKAAGSDVNKARAHGLVLQNMREVLTSHGLLLPSNDLSMAISTLSTQDYIHATRVILESWVYYKRFGVSILGVESGDDEGGD